MLIVILQNILQYHLKASLPVLQMSDDRDYAKITSDKQILKQFQNGQTIILSALVIKVNHVQKKQERVILITSKNIYNIIPQNGFNNIIATFIPNARIKRKISFKSITGITLSRHGTEFVIHVKDQHDYRYASANLKLKIVQAICEGYCNVIKKKMPLYYNDDKTLETFTTTIKDLQSGNRKKHLEDPQYVQPQSMNTQSEQKRQGKSTLVFKNSNSLSNITNFHQFQLLKVLGKGAFGKVMLCQLKSNKQLYAVKSMKKEYLIDQQHLQKARTQRKILEQANHPFLINLQYAFQSKDKIFFVMKFIMGGELFTHLKQIKKFKQSQTKFYAAQVYLALSYLHDKGYIYRDLKPENILMDTDGYLKLSDYGLAKELAKGGKTYSFVGTPQYVAPEVILKIGHGSAVDWWAFGTLIYEMMYGYPPFYNKDNNKMMQAIVKKPFIFSQLGKSNLSDQVQDLISKLLVKNPLQRFGSKNHTQIKNHPWFKDIDWDKLLSKQIEPIFIPPMSNILNFSYFDARCTQQDPLNSYEQVDNLLIQKFQKQFQGMSFAPKQYYQ